MWTIASNHQNASDFIRLMRIVINIGTPSVVVADKYTALTSSVFVNYLHELNIQLKFIPKSSPQCNGVCERVSNSITDRIRIKMISNNYRYGWFRYLKSSVEQYNFTPHSVTKFPPSYLLNGILPFNCLTIELPTLDEARQLAYIIITHFEITKPTRLVILMNINNINSKIMNSFM